MTCLVFSSQFHLETLAPVADSGFHCDTNSSGVWYSRLEWGSDSIVVLAPGFDNHFGMCPAVKPVHAQTLVSELPVKAFVGSILPGLARFN